MDSLSPQQRSEQMARVRSKDTKPEMIVRRLVHGMGYRYRLHCRDLPGTPDLVFPRLHKVIFIHGCFWHQHSCAAGNRIPKSHAAFWHEKLVANKRRDAKHRRQLNRAGWRVLTVWECQTKNTGRDALATRIVKFLES